MDKKLEQGNRKKVRALSWEQREAIVKVYLAGNLSRAAVWRMYTGNQSEHGHLLRWIDKLGYTDNKRYAKPIIRNQEHELSLDKTSSTLSKKSNPKPDQTEELQKRIKELEAALEIEKIRAEGYELLIDIAEKELKIPIRKKFDAK